MNLPPVIYEETPADGGMDSTQPCRDYSKGRCMRGTQCRFKHVEGPLPPMSSMRDDVMDLPPVSVFAPPPVAAIDLLEDEEEQIGLSDVVSDIVGLSEAQIANLTPEELIIHVEKRIRATEQDAQQKALQGYSDVPQSTLPEEDLPPLPPLPTPTVSTLVQGIPLDTVYQSLNELIKTAREDGIDIVQQAINDEEATDDNYALAFVKVLREAGLAFLEGKPMGYPAVPPPHLPPGFTSWVVVETTEEKAARLRKERQQREEQLARKHKRQMEYAKQMKISAQNKKFEQLQAEKFRNMKARISDVIDREHDASEVNKEGAREYLSGLENFAEMETVANLDSSNPSMDPSLLLLQKLLVQELQK